MPCWDISQDDLLSSLSCTDLTSSTAALKLSSGLMSVTHHVDFGLNAKDSNAQSLRRRPRAVGIRGGSDQREIDELELGGWQVQDL